MKRLWARIGTMITCTDEEYEELKELMETKHDDAEAFLWDLYNKNHELSGESYLPAYTDDNPNEEDFEF